MLGPRRYLLSSRAGTDDHRPEQRTSSYRSSGETEHNIQQPAAFRLLQRVCIVPIQAFKGYSWLTGALQYRLGRCTRVRPTRSFPYASAEALSQQLREEYRIPVLGHSTARSKRLTQGFVRPFRNLRQICTAVSGHHKPFCQLTNISLSYAGATVTEIAYGHRINSFDDEFFRLGEKWCQVASIGTRPSLLDIHPACEYQRVTHRHKTYHLLVACLPSWAPGAWFVKFIKGEDI